VHSGEDRNNQIFAWLSLIDGSMRPEDVIELPVLSGSMMPLMVPGKSVRIKRVEYYNLKAGDIAVFRIGNQLTAHRILMKFSFAGGFVYQKGDMNRFGCFVQSSSIIARVCAVQNQSGEYVDLSSWECHPGRSALREIIKLFFNIILFIPGKIKRVCIRK
jgi:hypothetical protein